MNNAPRIPPFQEGYEPPAPPLENQIRRDNDSVRVPKITLYDIDYAIIYQLSFATPFKINENGNIIDVPVFYASGEKWSQIRQYGYMRDGSGKIMAPAIVIKRGSVAEDERIPMLSLNNRRSQIAIFPYTNLNNMYDRFQGQYDRKESNEYYLLKFPNYVVVDYDLTIWTDLTEQMNSIVQKITDISDFMWGDYHTFRVKVNNFSFETVNAPGDDRLVKCTVSLKVDGRLREEFTDGESNILKRFTIKKVQFLNEKEESEFYLTDPNTGDSKNHVSQEPYESQFKNAKKNIRY
jgi:hypothetical protein